MGCHHHIVWLSVQHVKADRDAESMELAEDTYPGDIVLTSQVTFDRLWSLIVSYWLQYNVIAVYPCSSH